MKIFFIGFLLLLVCGCAPPSGLAQTAAPAAASLEGFAKDFWEWRAATQPFSSDDIPRIERPRGNRDWSRKAIEKQREALASFEKRWKALEDQSKLAAWQVDYRLMGSALARVKWELDINARWKRDPNFYVEQTLTPLVEALVIPGVVTANPEYSGNCKKR
jgi:hypothetical protein